MFCFDENKGVKKSQETSQNIYLQKKNTFNIFCFLFCLRVCLCRLSVNKMLPACAHRLTPFWLRKMEVMGGASPTSDVSFVIFALMDRMAWFLSSRVNRSARATPGILASVFKSVSCQAVAEKKKKVSILKIYKTTGLSPTSHSFLKSTKTIACLQLSKHL